MPLTKKNEDINSTFSNDPNRIHIQSKDTSFEIDFTTVLPLEKRKEQEKNDLNSEKNIRK